MRLITVLSLIGVTLAASTARGGLYESNLLGNPGFEDYYTGVAPEYASGPHAQYDLPLNPHTARGAQAWLNAGDDVCSIRTDGENTGHTGRFFGTGGSSSLPPSGVSRMRQEVDLCVCGFSAPELDDGSLVLSTGAWLSSWPADDDQVGFFVYFLGADRTPLACAFASGLQNHDGWIRYASGPVPLLPGTRYIRFDVEFVKQAGSNSDGRIDDAWVFLSRTENPPAPELNRNMVCNPGFESGTAGWMTRAGNPRVRYSGLDKVPAGSGDWFLFGGQRPMAGPDSRAVISQEITLSHFGFTDPLLDDETEFLFLQFGSWLYSYGNVGQIRSVVELVDASGTPVLRYDSGRVRSSLSPAPFRWQVRLPAGTRRIVLTLDLLDPEGTNLDGYVDDVSLAVTRIPHRPGHAKPFVVAHRGNSIVAPENTVASLTASRGAAQYAEFDTYACKSGELVVMHDSSVDRTTDGAGRIADLTLAELKLLDAGTWFAPDYAGEQVPTLSEALGALLPHVTPLIERKAGSPAAHLAELQRLGVQYDVVVQSFDWAFLAQLHALDPDVSLGALHSGQLTPARVEQARTAGAWFIALSAANVNPESIGLAHSAGLQLVAWTVNDPAEMKRFLDLGVDGIITDHPAAAGWLTNPSIGRPDFDVDADVDLADLAFLSGCRSAPAVGVDRPECGVADLDGDQDIDQSDFGFLQRCFQEAGRPVEPGCALFGDP